MAAKAEVSIVLRAVNYASEELNKVKQQTQGLREVGAQLQQTGLTMMGWGTAIAAPFGLALKQFMGFEEEMRNVNAVMQGTEEDFQILSKSINEVAMNSSFMTSEIASAAYALASAGKKRVEIEAMIGPVSNLAEAMHSELRPTAELVTDTLDQFGMTAEETARVVDIFATSVGSSPETLERLAYGMRYAGSTAAGFDYSLEETVAALMAFETAGIHGEQAGTTFRNALARLAAPTSQVTEALQKYGLTIDQVNPAQHSFVEILETMRRAGVDTTGAYEIFGTEIGGRMAAAISTGVEKIKEFTATLEDSAGAAERMKEEQLSSLAGQFKLLKSSLESLGNSFATLFRDEVANAVSWIRDLANWLNNLDEGTKKLIVNVAKWGSILLIGAGAVNFLTGTVMKTIASFKNWGAILGSLIKLISGKTAAAGAAGQALTTLSGTAAKTGSSLAAIGSSVGGLGAKLLAFATGPVGITIAAIAGITAGSIALYKVMDDLSKDWFSSDLEKALNQTREAADGTVETMEEVSRKFSTLSSTAENESNRLSGTISGTFMQLQAAVQGFDVINSTVAVKSAMNMQKIAEEAGYTGNAFRDLAKEFSESLTLSSDEVVEKLRRVMDEVDSVALDTEATNKRISTAVEEANQSMVNTTRETQSVLANLSSSYDEAAKSVIEATSQQVRAIDTVQLQAVGSTEAFVTMMETQKTAATEASNEIGLALARVAVSMSEQGKLSKDQVAGINELLDEYARLSEELDTVSEHFGANSSQAMSLKSSLNTLKEEIAELGWSAGESAVRFGNVNEVLQETAKEVEKTGGNINDFLFGSDNLEATNVEVFERVRDQFKGTEKDSIALVNAFQKLTKPAKMFGNEVDVMGVAMADFGVELMKNNVLVTRQTEWLSTLANSIAQTREEYREAVKQYGENSEEATKLKEALQELEVIYGRQGKAAAQSIFDTYGFGETLVYLRENLGLTGEALAKMLGIADSKVLSSDAAAINEQWKKVNEGSSFASAALKSIQEDSKAASTKLSEMADSTTETFEKQKKSIVSLREELDTLKTKQVEYLDALAKAEAEGDTKAIENYRNRLEETANAAGSLAEKIQTQTDEMSEFYKIFEENAGKTGEFGDALKEIEPELESFASSLNEIEVEFDETWSNIISASKNGADAVIAEFRRASDEIVGHSIVPEMKTEIIREMVELATGMRDEASRGAANSMASFADLSDGLRDYLSLMQREATSFSMDSITTVAAEFPEYFSNLSHEATKAVGNMKEFYDLRWLDDVYRGTTDKTRDMSHTFGQLQSQLRDLSGELGDFIPSGADLSVPKIERKKEYHIFLDIKKEEYADKDELIRRIARELELAGEI